MAWAERGDALVAESAGYTVRVAAHPFTLRIDAGGMPLVATKGGEGFPTAPLAVMGDGAWRSPRAAPSVSINGDEIALAWDDGIGLTLTLVDDGDVAFRLRAPGAEAVALALESHPDEHYYGLGERFGGLDQRGEIVDLWVKNGASGGNTYKPVPFVASSRGFGLVLDTSHRVHCALAHPTVPGAATFVVHAAETGGAIIPGPEPARVLERYTTRVGRPPVPPEWVFLPWKSRDWRSENQKTALEDITKQRELGIACGVKLIDAAWEATNHTFVFTPDKFPDPAAMIATAAEAGQRVVLWISPWMVAGTDEYREAAERGYLIRDGRGEPSLHRLANRPTYLGTMIDFTSPAAVAWWQGKIRDLMELGVRGFKTDFGEQVPEDAFFADGRTGAELHNLYPVLYNRATWEVVRQYDGILLARSAWAGSQPYPGIWAGDQSADFSPWAGLPSAITAGISAGWSGFPYWGSDIGGYFGTPEDECFVRWTQFAAFSPIMEAHGLGPREPWLFEPSTLETYRRFANLHARLTPYSRAAAAEAARTGMPLMRAMPLAFPNEPNMHGDPVQYQFMYGPSLLVAPIYSWGTSRLVHFPSGIWTDFFTGERHVGPAVAKVDAPLDRMPVYVKDGSVLPLRQEPTIGSDVALALDVYPGGDAEQLLADGTRITLASQGNGTHTVGVVGPERAYELRTPHRRLRRVARGDDDLPIGDEAVSWRGDASLTLSVES